MTTKSKLSDHTIELIMGSLLITGVIISGTMVLLGGTIYLLQFGNDIPHFKTFRGEPSDLRSVKEILHGVTEFNSLSIIQLGILLLIATPIARVVFSVAGFLIEKDYLYVLISLIVLGIIGYSILNP